MCFQLRGWEEGGNKEGRFGLREEEETQGRMLRKKVIVTEQMQSGFGTCGFMFGRPNAGEKQDEIAAAALWTWQGNGREGHGRDLKADFSPHGTKPHGWCELTLEGRGGRSWRLVFLSS